MPHVVVKLWPGPSEQQKARLAEAITRDVMAILCLGEESVSVAVEEVEARDWAEQVYKPDITWASGGRSAEPGAAPDRGRM